MNLYLMKYEEFIYSKTCTYIIMFCDVPIPVLTLGTFHFDFPNLDKIQYAKDEMIDVLEPRYQDEINKLVNALSEFAPTIIMIERPVKM